MERINGFEMTDSNGIELEVLVENGRITVEYDSKYHGRKVIFNEAVDKFNNINYRNFLPVIKKAIAACENSDISASDHFAQVRNMIETGKGASKPIAPQGAVLMAISQN